MHCCITSPVVVESIELPPFSALFRILEARGISLYRDQHESVHSDKANNFLGGFLTQFLKKHARKRIQVYVQYQY